MCTNRLHETRMMHSGEIATITRYDDSLHVWATFKDGTQVGPFQYSHFKNGDLANPAVSLWKTGKQRHKGETRTMNNGLKATIVEYNGCEDMTVRFEDDYEKIHVTYDAFKKGNVSNPNIPTKHPARMNKERLGEEGVACNGMRMKIIKYNSDRDLDVQFADGTIVKHVNYQNFQRGNIANPNVHTNNHCSYNELLCAYYFSQLGFRKFSQSYYRAMGMGCKEFDMYNPDLKVAIEYDGGRFHIDRFRNKDIAKDAFAKENDIFLYRIREPQCSNYNTSDNVKLYGINSSEHANPDLMETIEMIFDDIAKRFGINKKIQIKEGDIDTIYNLYHQSKAKIRDRVGERRTMKNGRELELIAWHNYQNIDLKDVNSGEIVLHKRYQHFKRGAIL